MSLPQSAQREAPWSIAKITWFFIYYEILNSHSQCRMLLLRTLRNLLRPLRLNFYHNNLKRISLPQSEQREAPRSIAKIAWFFIFYEILNTHSQCRMLLLRSLRNLLRPLRLNFYHNSLKHMSLPQSAQREAPRSIAKITLFFIYEILNSHSQCRMLLLRTLRNPLRPLRLNLYHNNLKRISLPQSAQREAPWSIAKITWFFIYYEILNSHSQCRMLLLRTLRNLLRPLRLNF